MFVKPAPGLKVRDPVKKDYLPVSGRTVPDNIYWTRRVQFGDVVIASAPTPVPAPPAAKKAPAVLEGGDKV